MLDSDDRTTEAVATRSSRMLVGCWFAATGLAMNCQSGAADDGLMRRVSHMVDMALSQDDPLRLAVADLARQWPHLRRPHQAEALKAAGVALMRAVERSSWPAPSGRADLDG